MNKKNIILLVGIIITGISMLFMVIGCICSLFRPIDSGIFALIGIVTPILIIINIVITALWVFAWNRIAIICIGILITCMSQIATVIQIPILKHVRADGPSFKVMSYNAHFFTSENHIDVLDATLEYINESNASVVCIQELATSKQDILKEISTGLNKYRYKYIHKVSDTTSSISYYSAIFSKFIIADKGNIDHNAVANSTIYADILYQGDTVRIINSHLQSNYVNKDELNFSNHEGDEFSGTNIFKLLTINQKLSRNTSLRAKQAEKVSDLVKASNNVILCGDLNSVPTSYVYRKVKGKLRDSFVEKGKWRGHTYKYFGDFFRIDYIFHSKKFECVSYTSPEVLWSDHKPIIVELKYNKDYK